MSSEQDAFASLSTTAPETGLGGARHGYCLWPRSNAHISVRVRCTGEAKSRLSGRAYLPENLSKHLAYPVRGLKGSC